MRQGVLRFLADLRFAIAILLLIALFSVLGTVIEQDQSIEFYKLNYPLTNKIFGFLSWDIILKLGFDHVYKTWWFISCIVIFGFSLLTCTFLQQFPSLKIARRCQFFRVSKQFERLNNSIILKNPKFFKLLFKIKENKYSIFQQKNIVYAYKGLLGRIGPIIVHFSMILILLGTLLSAINGFKAEEIIPKTETFHIQNVLTNGNLTSIPKLSSRVNDFWITYNSQNNIKQFYSDISIINANAKEVYRKTIFVNSPINYKGVNFYQTDWNLIGLRIQIKSSQILQYPLINFLDNQSKLWISWIPVDESLNKGIIILVNNLQGYCSVYNEYSQFLGNLELNELFEKELPITLVDILCSTGLQIKMDSGITLIYTGFLFLIISISISYITYSQIWVIRDKNKMLIGGTTTRGIFEFEIEFFKIIKI